MKESGETEVNGLSEGRSWSERQQARGTGSPARVLPHQAGTAARALPNPCVLLAPSYSAVMQPGQ